jgi:hypothetical protein
LVGGNGREEFVHVILCMVLRRGDGRLWGLGIDAPTPTSVCGTSIGQSVGIDRCGVAVVLLVLPILF